MHLRFTGCLKKTLMCFIIQLKYIIHTLSLLDYITSSQDFCKQTHLICQQCQSHALSPLMSKSSGGFDSLNSSAHTKRKWQLHSLGYRAVCRVSLFWLHQKKIKQRACCGGWLPGGDKRDTMEVLVKFASSTFSILGSQLAQNTSPDYARIITP